MKSQKGYVNVGTIGHVDYGDDQKVKVTVGGRAIGAVIIDGYVYFEADHQEITGQTGHKKPFYQKGRW